MTKIFQCYLLFGSLTWCLSACSSSHEGVGAGVQRSVASTIEKSAQPQILSSPRELLAQASPWRGFEALDPLLSLVRLEKISKNCRGVLSQVGRILPAPAALSLDAVSLLKGWGEEVGAEAGKDVGKEEEYIKAVEKCDSFPCGVKLNRSEVEVLEKKPKKEREPAFRDLVLQRVLKALKTGERKEFEFPGDPIDPYAFFIKKGFPAMGTLVAGAQPAAQVWSRKFDLSPGNMRVLRQVVQSRFEKNSNEAQLELRDLYTSHYFDSWGEWVQVKCDPVTAGSAVDTGVLVQSLVIEFDLLKNNDLISLISKGKMRNGVRERGSQYLDQQAELILK